MDWRFKVDGPIKASPAVVDDRVYVTSEAGTLFALGTESGDEQWRFEAGAALRCVPSVTTDGVYVVTADGTLIALDLDGSERWRHDTEQRKDANYRPEERTEDGCTVAGGVVYTGLPDERLYALDATNGSVLWETSLTGVARSAPTLANGSLYVGTGRYREMGTDERLSVYALTAETGEINWRVELDIAWVATPVIRNDTLYTIEDDNVHALAAESGDRKWKYSLDNLGMSTPAVTEDTAFFATMKLGHDHIEPVIAGIRAVDLASGEERWAVDESVTNDDAWGGDQFTGPAVTDELVVTGSDRGVLRCFDAATGTLRWHLRPTRSPLQPPAIAGDAVYVGSEYGNLYAIRGRDATTTETTGNGTTGN